MKQVYLAVVFGILCTYCQAQSTKTPSVEGVWKIVLKKDRELIKPLKIYQQGNEWKAVLGKTSLPIQQKQGKFIIHWKKAGAQFEGAFADNQQTIKGFWRQYRYASPVKLTKTAEGWEGNREVQFQQLTLFLIIRRDQKTGTLKSHIYNHERNQGTFIWIEKTEQKGRKVFVTLDGLPNLKGTLSQDGKTLDMPIHYYGLQGKVFRKVDPTKEVRMQPRLGQKTYAYTRPKQINDGWQTASLKDMGADMGKIKEMIEAILTKKYPSLHSVLITYKSKLVLEEYFYGYHREQLHDTRSAGKSFASAMIGLALDRNLLTSIDQKVVDLFPQYKGQIKNMDERKKRLRIRDLMTMSPGLDCNDDRDESLGNENVFYDDREPDDWTKYTLDLPMVNEPGKKAFYCSAGVNLLGQIVGNVAGKPNYEFIHEHLFEPLGIRRFTFYLTPKGHGYQGGGMFFRPRDLAKFGQVYLNEGTWNGKRLLSKAWVQATGKGQSTMYNHPYKNYGYNWWVHRFKVGNQTYESFHASGNGGQLIFVVPSLQLVVAFNAGNYRRYRIWRKYRDELMPNYIIPAILKMKK
ncbi:MAG TPA: hypothetical protein DCS93_13460 [Microscillaceae bacterium]|nr:hypothetical protein [Microscillaceae bacterium]